MTSFKKATSVDNIAQYDKKPVKFKWHDGEGRKLTAGGILLYDEGGIWTVGEVKKISGQVIYSDIGGKYNSDDCDIWQTISREFAEETYHSLGALSRKRVMELSEKYQRVYVNGRKDDPVYICLVVPSFEVDKIDVELFDERRKTVLSQNPDVPLNFYSVDRLCHIKFDDLKKYNLSYRLRVILKQCPFKEVDALCHKVNMWQRIN